MWSKLKEEPDLSSSPLNARRDKRLRRGVAEPTNRASAEYIANRQHARLRSAESEGRNMEGKGMLKEEGEEEE